MSFLTPFMLFGALAASIPIAIHLFFRSRYRTVPWAAMKFLLTSVEQTSRRLRFQELLLLVLRVCILLMLALAFARPISSVVRGAGRGDAVDAVFVFDTSFSMGASDGDDKTRLARAKLEAIKIIDELPAHSTVQIIACAGNTKTLLGPHSPGNLDQARKIIDESLDLTSMATDLAQGVADAKEVLTRGQASNKELYVFSDMQKLGFDQQTSDLRQTLHDIKEKAVVHFVRCGSRPVKNVAIVGITPQSGVPRPGDRVGFAVLVKNTGTEAVENLTVSLAVDGDEKNRETTAIVKLPPKETRAVTLNGKLDKAGLRVLTARVGPDDLSADNQFDQVILVREQVNILVVDGAYKETAPAESSSYYLMHALLPVKETDRPRYHLQPRVVPARLASPALLARQDICILVNCSLQAKLGKRAETVPNDFVEALEPFVRQGHGLIVFSGENVQPDVYNKLLFKKHPLMPLPIKAVIRASENKPFLIDRGSFSLPAFWKFKEDGYYEDLSKAEIWKYLDLDEAGAPPKEKTPDAEPVETSKKDDSPVNVVVRLSNGRPLIAARKVDAGEVIFITTAADIAFDEKSMWTNWSVLPSYVPVMATTITHLLQGQTQTYNLVAGQALNWYPTEKMDHSYELLTPAGKSIRLGLPEKIGKRSVVVANDLPRAGVYRVIAMPRGSDTSVTLANNEAGKSGTPIAVVPDLRESEDLTTLADKEIDQALGFAPIHLTAGGAEAASTGADRLNREWTVWALLTVLGLVLAEVVLAWWCGKAW